MFDTRTRHVMFGVKRWLSTLEYGDSVSLVMIPDANLLTFVISPYCRLTYIMLTCDAQISVTLDASYISPQPDAAKHLQEQPLHQPSNGLVKRQSAIDQHTARESDTETPPAGVERFLHGGHEGRGPQYDGLPNAATAQGQEHQTTEERATGEGGKVICGLEYNGHCARMRQVQIRPASARQLAP